MTERSRGRDRRRKRKRSDDFEDDGISGWKLGLVIGVIVVCFAMLYPTVFHPMIMGFFGGKDQSRSNGAHKPPIHPGMGPGGPRTGGPRHDHPAMRMAAAQHDNQQATGGGRGMFTWMLPIYTVGVVIFLLYTLFKSKKKKKRRGYGSESDDSESEEENSGQFSGKLGKKKLRGLQERLRQTEDAMTKILEQLEQVQAQGLDLGAMEQVTPKKDTKKKEVVPAKPVLSAESEQYIGDLEKALKEFKVLSEAYEKEKDRHLADDSDEDMTSDSELNSSASSADSEEEERVRQKERSRRRKDKEKKKKQAMEWKESDEVVDDDMPTLEDNSEEEKENVEDEPALELEKETVEELQEDNTEKIEVISQDHTPEYDDEPIQESRIESKPVEKKVRKRARRT